MKIKKNLTLKIILWIIVLFIWVILFPQDIHHWENPQLCYKSNFRTNNCYDLEIADTPELRTQWLMNRESLWEKSWIIFLFDSLDIHKFRMKNTLIPLDMIRLDENFEIIDIVQAQPCKQEICPVFWPELPSNYVLELNLWESSKIWLKIWSKFKKYGNR